MTARRFFVYLAAVVFAASLFSGCATVPQETLDEKEAVIQSLNSQVDSLKQEVKRLQDTNDELSRTKADMDSRISELERAQQEFENKIKENAKKQAAPAVKKEELELK